VTRLTVFYDPRCGLCCAVRDWLGRQRQILAVDCVPKDDTSDELVVVADSGEVWSGDSAWVMVLWALEDYRPWARRLASPVLLPAARAAFARLSKYRGTLSCQLGLPPDLDRRDDEYTRSSR
jgi:predicted DCC family thiol-disulfide oxidoreductase YuxK